MRRERVRADIAAPAALCGQKVSQSSSDEADFGTAVEARTLGAGAAAAARLEPLAGAGADAWIDGVEGVDVEGATARSRAVAAGLGCGAASEATARVGTCGREDV